MATKFRANKQIYLDKDTQTTFAVWHPEIKVKGRWCVLSDPSSRSTLVEAPDEETAYELAIQAIRRGIR